MDNAEVDMKGPIKVIGAILFLSTFYLFCSFGFCEDASHSTSASAGHQVSRDVIPKAWLKKKTTVEQAERKNLVSDKRLGPKPVPFGFINDKWQKFTSGIREGDELWEFESSAESWGALAGRAGFCIVRRGNIVDAIITKMN
jgi:hypothetical protein